MQSTKLATRQFLSERYHVLRPIIVSRLHIAGCNDGDSDES